MTAPAQAPEDARRQYHDSRLERLTLACTRYELQAVRRVAIYLGVIPKVATRGGKRAKSRHVGAILLRTRSLNAIVAEYERLKAAGELAD